MKKQITLVTAHILGWLLFFSLPLLFRPDPELLNAENLAATERMMQTSFLINAIFLVLFFYANIRWIYPFTVGRNKYRNFIVLESLMLCLFIFMTRCIYWLVTGNEQGKAPPFLAFIFYSITTMIGLCYYLINRNIIAEKVQSEIENEMLKVELQFLRWQISPHFLFNVLNNMAAMARLKSDQLESMIIKLSSLLRYMLYDGGDHKISVEKEIEYLNSYIYLQKLRLGNAVDININMDIQGGDQYNIEPMLLIPFVENAFKHGVSIGQTPLIHLNMTINNGKMLFELRNRYDDDQNKDKTSGIGLVNVRKRLNMLYAGDASLVISKENGLFTVVLSLQFR